MNYYSQYGEDQLLAKIFYDQPVGFYVDVGCNSPVSGSNTFMLYEKGWSGICLDPHASFEEDFKHVRPRDLFLPLAIAGHDGEIDLHYQEGAEGVSSILPSAWNKNVKKVPCRRLTTIMEQYGQDRMIDLLSVDVEGVEIEVLESLDFDRFAPKIIMAEFNTLGIINHALQPYLISKGYHILQVSVANFVATRNFQRDWAANQPEGIPQRM